jgi:hypothetical protein
MNPARAKAREQILTDALIDSVSLSEINWRVKEQNPSLPLAAWKSETMEMVRSLLSDGLLEIGDRGEGGRFQAWDIPHEQAMRKVSDVYLTRHEDKASWAYFCWFKLTEIGRQQALSTDEGKRIARDVEEQLARRPTED